jgi:hypothetical protein
VLAEQTLAAFKNFTKWKNYDWTNLCQRDWTGYTSSNHADLHKRFYGEWLLM